MPNLDPQLLSFITSCLKAGQTFDQIGHALIVGGWSQKTIDDAFAFVSKDPHLSVNTQANISSAQVTILPNNKPVRWFAIPILGFIIKCLILIPCLMILQIMGCFISILTIINAFFVLFLGKIWGVYYRFGVGLIKFSAGMEFYFWGLTDTYPDFAQLFDGDKAVLNEQAGVVLIAFPTNPNRLYAIPLVGIGIKYIILIPYFLYVTLIRIGAGIGGLFASLVVLFKGQYPEGIYQLVRDSIILQVRLSSYVLGFSDSYPDFTISTDHAVLKVILVVGGLFLSILLIGVYFLFVVTSLVALHHGAK